LQANLRSQSCQPTRLCACAERASTRNASTCRMQALRRDLFFFRWDFGFDVHVAEFTRLKDLAAL
jgi:hypothetical protein